MKHKRILAWLTVSGLATLSACSSTSAVKQSVAPVESTSGSDPLKYGQSKQPTTFDNDSNKTVTSLKTIAVTDISYSQEFRDAFYFEEKKIKRSDLQSESNLQDSGAKPFEPMTKDEIQESNANTSQSDSSTNNSFEQTHTKKYGIERKIYYGEIRGLSGPIKGMLLKAGYKVIQAKPNVARLDQNDDYFDILKRNDAGDFDGADYVLFGVLTGLSQNTHSSPITGTKNYMSINDLAIAIDFSLIDTKTHHVVASFVASGSANDNRIDGEAEGYKPNTTKMLQQLSVNLAENVAYHLASQDFVISEIAHNPATQIFIPGTDKYRNNERNLKVYK